jgi:simple sugar transport system permease protein
VVRRPGVGLSHPGPVRRRHHHAGRTGFGRSLYAIGSNIDAAKAAGIRTGRVLWTVLVVAGLLAALSGLMLSGRLASAASAQGSGDIFTVFAAAVIGGISLNGGNGNMFGFRVTGGKVQD